MVRFILFASGTISGIGKGNTSAAVGKILMEHFEQDASDYDQASNNEEYFLSDSKYSKYKIVPIKIDPYLNVTPSTINPISHGEIFVTEDGTESDMDFGIYERNLGIFLSGSNNITGGKLNIIQQQNVDMWLGETITFTKTYPLIEKMILEAITRTCLRNYPTFKYQRLESINQVSNDIIVLLEIGGTLNDSENVIFLEYLADLKERLENEGGHYFKVVNIDLLPIQTGEIKTKLVQNSIRLFRKKGLPSSLSVCRISGYKWSADKSNMLEKLHYNDDTFLGSPVALHKRYERFDEIRKYLRSKNIRNPILSPDLANTYNLSYVLHEQGLDDIILKLIGLEIEQRYKKVSILPFFGKGKDILGVSDEEKAYLSVFSPQTPIVCNSSKKHLPIEIFDPYPWTFYRPYITINVAIITKYSKNMDSYRSVIDSLLICGLMEKVKVNIIQIDAEQIEKKVRKEISRSNKQDLVARRISAVSKFFHCINVTIIPGGFGIRGTEGKIFAIEYCRTKNIPTLGICLGFQLSIIEFMRNVLHLNATSQEFMEEGDNTTTTQNDILTPIRNSEDNEFFEPGRLHKVIKIIEGTGRSDSTLRLGEKLTVLDKNSKVKQIYNQFSRVKTSLGELISHSTHGTSDILGKVCICGFCKTDIGCTRSYTGVNDILSQDIETSLEKIPQENRLIIQERHRHRYEVNPKYVPLLEKHKFNFVARDLFNKERYSIFENNNQDFFIGIQYHPEMTTNLENGHPLFRLLIREGMKNKLNDMKKKKKEGKGKIVNIKPHRISKNTVSELKHQ